MMREALEFYANFDRWRDFVDDTMAALEDGNMGSELGHDMGEKARLALAATPASVSLVITDDQAEKLAVLINQPGFIAHEPGISISFPTTPTPVSHVMVGPVGYVGKASLQLLKIGDLSGCALTADPPSVAHVALFDRPIDLNASAPDQVPEELKKLTFAVQHNPNCPSPWLVRLPGKSLMIDMLPYGDALGRVRHQTGDILGFGKTLAEAARAAIAVAEGLKE